MSRIERAPEIREDIDRILGHLHKFDVENPPARIDDLSGISLLQHNPLIGRTLESELGELVIGRWTHGYIALYRCVPEIDTGFLMTIRGQREAGYSRAKTFNTGNLPFPV